MQGNFSKSLNNGVRGHRKCAEEQTVYENVINSVYCTNQCPCSQMEFWQVFLRQPLRVLSLGWKGNNTDVSLQGVCTLPMAITKVAVQESGL